MSNIKKIPNDDISSKKLKIKNKKEVAKVLTKNKTTVVTAKKSSNVRKKPVVKKVVKPVEAPVDVKEEVVTQVTTETKPVAVKIENKKNDKNNNKKIVYKKSKPEKVKEDIKEETKEKVAEEVVETKVEVVEAKENIKEEIKEEVKEDIKQEAPKKQPQSKAMKKANKKAKKKPEKAIEEDEVKSAIKPKDEEHVTIKKEEDNKDIKTIKVAGVDNIKKRAASQKPPVQKTKTKPKTGTKKDDVKKVKSVYDPQLNRWVIKEDKEQIKKDKKAKKQAEREERLKKEVQEERESYLTDTQFSGLKAKFIEEVYVDNYKEEVKKNAKKVSKKFLICIIVLMILAGVAFLGYKLYKSNILAGLHLYPEYKLGQQVKLKDGSIWYVVEDSDGSKGELLLLDDSLVDINGDGQITILDQKAYSLKSSKYDVKDETCIAYYLENEYKPKLEEQVGTVKEISLFTSKQYVNFRKGMHYNYDWKDENILASNAVNYYWLLSEQNNKVYVVRRDGTYKLTGITAGYYVRIVIKVDKSSIQKEEKKEETQESKETKQEK